MGTIEASCHCGAIRVVIDSAPTEITECNCSICRRYGARWAYYSKSQVRFEPDVPVTETYRWGERSIDFHRCSTCGCVTHWSPVEPEAQRIGVNARLMTPDVVAAARPRFLDGAATWQYLNE